MRMLLTGSARCEMPSSCMATAAAAAISPSDELDLSFIRERLTLRDLGEVGRSNPLSSFELFFDCSVDVLDLFVADPEQEVLVVLLDEVLD